MLSKQHKPPRKGRSKQPKAVSRDQDPVRLPPVVDQLTVGTRLRFVTTGNFNGALSVSFTNLLDAWLIAGTATNGYQLFDFVRIKRVTLRGMCFAVGSQTSTCTVGIEFPGLVAGLGGAGNQIEETGIGYTAPALVTLCPGSHTLAALYQSANNANAFVIRAVDGLGAALQGVVVDVDLVYKNSADVSPAAVASAISGATPGDLYYGGLDGGRLAATAARSTFQRRI